MLRNTFYNSSGKGVSPIIAAVMLLAFTITLAGLMGPWALEMINDLQEGSSEATTDAINTSQSSIELRDIEYDSENNKITGYLQNTGSTKLTNFTLTTHGNNTTQKRLTQTLNPQQITSFTIENIETRPETLQAASNQISINHQKQITKTQQQNNENGDNGGELPDTETYHWPFDEGSGDTAENRKESVDFDVSSPTWQSGNGKGDHYLEFNDDTASAPYQSEWTGVDKIAVSMWLRTTYSDTYDIMIGVPNDGGTTNTDGWYIYSTGNTNLSMSIDQAGTGYIPDGDWNDGDWHMATFVYQNSEVKSYLDGQLVSTEGAADSIANVEKSLLVGGSRGDSRTMNGDYDDLRIWTDEIPSDSDVLEYYENTKQNYS